MMHKGKTLALALGALAVSSGAFALVSDSSSNPYRGIVERNVFNIHDAPPPAVIEPVINRPPPPNIRLQGITDILGRKQVLFKVQLPPRPGAPAKEESFILTVGDRQGEIEVLAIDPKAGTVQMRNYGVITNLSLDVNSDKIVTAPPTAPNFQPQPAPMAAPGAMAPPPSLPTLPPGKFPRTLRLPNAPGAQSGSTSGQYPPDGGGYSSANQNPQQKADDEHLNQVANLALQKKAAQLSNDPRIRGMAPIIPLPADIQKEFDNEQNGGPPQLPQ